jgi:hypothetical protein
MAAVETPAIPRVDIGALSGEVRLSAIDWLAEALAAAFWRVDDLEEEQKVRLTADLVGMQDELELRFARSLYRVLELEGSVTTWGLPHDLERLVVKEPDDA